MPYTICMRSMTIFHSLRSWVMKLHHWSCDHEGLLLILTLMLFVRLPNLAEPYWYGDEAIYLTIGTALRHGQAMYAEIVDHKTPLIYYLAMVPNQFLFRLLLISWMTATTVLWHSILRRVVKPRWLVLFGTTLFMLFTTWPGLEGNIPNGELFVMGFIIAAWWLLSRTTLFPRLLNKTAPEDWNWPRVELALTFTAGAVASLGILTKVPGLLDVAALGSLFFLTAWRHFSSTNWRMVWQWAGIGLITFAAGVATPVLVSILYYWSIGSFNAYLQFGLLYNLHYTSNWVLPFTQPWLLTAFTLPAKVGILVVTFLLVLLISRWRKTSTFASWSAFWLIATLVAATLSNRPYPHYLLQAIPPVVAAITFFLSRRTAWISRGLIIGAIGLGGACLWLLDFGLYETVSYYQRYFRLITGQMSNEEYRYSFNWLVRENEQLVPIIQTGSDPREPIFIWGTNPMLYAQAQRHPASRFTVAFHIHDLKNYAETLAEVRQAEPQYIVVLKEESPLPGLAAYLDEQYLKSAETDHMVLYRRSTIPDRRLLQ